MCRIKLSTSGSTGPSHRRSSAARPRSSPTARSRASGASTVRAPTRPWATTPTASSVRCSWSPTRCAVPSDKLVMCEVELTDFTPHPTNTRAKLREVVEKYGDQEPMFGIEQEYTFFKDGRPLGLAGPRLPGPAGPVLLRRGRRQDARAGDRRAPHRGLHRCRHRHRGHQRRGHDGPVGVPGRGALAPRRLRPPVGGPLAAVPHRRGLRGLRHPRAQAHPGRLERRRGPHQLLHQGHARGGRLGRHHRRVRGHREEDRRAHRRLRRGHREPPDRGPRDRPLHQVQLRDLGPGRLHPHPVGRGQGQEGMARGPAAQRQHGPLPGHRRHHRDRLRDAAGG